MESRPWPATDSNRVALLFDEECGVRSSQLAVGMRIVLRELHLQVCGAHNLFHLETNLGWVGI